MYFNSLNFKHVSFSNEKSENDIGLTPSMKVTQFPYDYTSMEIIKWRVLLCLVRADVSLWNQCPKDNRQSSNNSLDT